MKWLSIVFIFSLSFASAQSVEEDSAAYQIAFDWLERKLTYNYFDATNQHWWVNRLQVNENGSINIKNIAAKHPEKVLEKVYYNRTFFLHDLNPNIITVIDLPSDQGRFVKGKIVRIEGFEGEAKIRNVKDGRIGSNLNHINISIPKVLEDSVENYALQVKEQLAKAAYLGSRYANRGQLDENLENVFTALTGNFRSEDSTATLSLVRQEPRLVRFELKDGEEFSYGTIGYDQKLKVVFLLKSSSDSYDFKTFIFDESDRNLKLKSKEDEIFLIGRNTFKINIGGWNDTFFRY